ncbi:hypothetical protein ES705_03553 [subsurface metagenome]
MNIASAAPEIPAGEAPTIPPEKPLFNPNASPLLRKDRSILSSRSLLFSGPVQVWILRARLNCSSRSPFPLISLSSLTGFDLTTTLKCPLPISFSSSLNTESLIFFSLLSLVSPARSYTSLPFVILLTVNVTCDLPPIQFVLKLTLPFAFVVPEALPP